MSGDGDELIGMNSLAGASASHHYITHKPTKFDL